MADGAAVGGVDGQRRDARGRLDRGDERDWAAGCPLPVAFLVRPRPEAPARSWASEAGGVVGLGMTRSVILGGRGRLESEIQCGPGGYGRHSTTFMVSRHGQCFGGAEQTGYQAGRRSETDG